VNLKPLSSLFTACVLVALALSAACSGNNSSSAVAPLPGPTTLPPTTVPQTPTPVPQCTATASNEQALDASGGTLTIPAACGFSGTVGYAPNTAPSGMTIEFMTSEANVNNVPQPDGGTPILYTRVKLGTKTGGQVAFQAGDQQATLISTHLLPSQTYALCGYIGEFVIQNKPQIAGSPASGSLSYQSPLTAQGLKATGGVLPTGVNIDTVSTLGVPKSCKPAAAAERH
jgi:hypothetical protein